MTEKELHKLHKTELLELLLTFRKELDGAKAENARLKKKLEAAESRNELLEKIWDTVSETASLMKQRCSKETTDDLEQ